MRTLCGWAKTVLIVAACLLAAGAPASAQEDFANLSANAYRRPANPPATASFFADPGWPGTHITVRPEFGLSGRPRGGPITYCVRSCDGRFFPVSGRGDQSHADVCKNFCPSADVNVYSGSSIEDAYTPQGKPYSKSVNAFRYRNELVPNCSCNGVSALGLSYARIEDDPTIRSGDIIAKAEGMMVAVSSDRRRSGIMFRPLSASTARAYGLAPRTASR